jgi:hypothetical protein
MSVEAVWRIGSAAHGVSAAAIVARWLPTSTNDGGYRNG